LTHALPFPDEVTREITATLAAAGLEVYHLEWKPAKRRGFLELTIDRPGGVSLADCARASGLVGDLLDQRGVPETPYSLEVASPGLDRRLFTLADCVRFTGERVRVQLLTPTEGTSRLKGRLERVEGETVTVLDEDRDRRYTVRFGDVKLARLIPDFGTPDENQRETTERSTR
jgi:ribosome maturation factor RimP